MTKDQPTMNKKPKMAKVRHSSLDLSEPPEAKQKPDVISKARLKFLNLSDALRHKNPEEHKKAIIKSMTQCTLDYFFRSHKARNHVFENTSPECSKPAALQKHNSIDTYPIRIEVTAEDDDEVIGTLDRTRPATICVDKPSEVRSAEALALERPRKKLSFREPEVIKHKDTKNSTLSRKNEEKHSLAPPRNAGKPNVSNGILHRAHSFDDTDLESQAMRVVRTIGQAFEVCHRLQIEAPPEPAAADGDLDDGATCTQDLLSDRLSDAPSDRPADRARHRDLISDAASDKMSLPPDDSSYRDSYLEGTNKNSNCKPPQLDILPPPPNNNKKSGLASAETYAAPHSDGLGGGGGGSGGGSGGSASSLPPAGGALSAHHELQLLREQLAQQSQQTREALAQLQLTREQLAAEQSARLEAQARTHQLLVHNRELLDHIAALVAHLQGDKSGQHQTPPHMAMPQQSQQSSSGENSYLTQDQEFAQAELNAALQALGLSQHALIENRSATTCLPTSPLRSSFPPTCGTFNFGFPPVEPPSFEAQWLQRLQTLGSYRSTAQFPFGYGQPLSFVPQMYGQGLLNNNYTLQMPPQKKPPPQSGIATLPRYTGESRFGTRSSEPRQMPSTQYQSYQNLLQAQNVQNKQQQFSQPQTKPQLQTSYANINHNQNLHVHREVRRDSSPHPQGSSQNVGDNAEGIIKPLAQMGTLTTTDSEGRVRVIVPVPADSNEQTSNTLFSNLRIGDDGRLYTGPMGPITRTASEKVPNRSELMDQMRSTWSRHTTK